MMLRQSVKEKVVTAVILLAVWWVLSGKFDLLHFGTGVAVSLALGARYAGVPDGARFRAGRFLLFVPWLVWQVVLSNLRVARVVLSRRMAIRPMFISQAPGVRGDRALTMLGSSTTLTPGTLTIDISNDEMLVHALDERSALDTRDQIIARRVARVFERRRA
jgi:multicomponent Na+:H+ antiporter subunit E